MSVRQAPAGEQHLTRRAFVSGMLGAGLHAQNRDSVTLTIERAQIDVAPGHTITTATYNGPRRGR